MNSGKVYLRVKKTVRKAIAYSGGLIQAIKVQFKIFRISSLPIQHKTEANVLIVKNRVYAKVAKVCIVSFCYFNSSSLVKVHVDSLTAKYVQSALRGLIRKGRVKLVYVPCSDDKWQLQKLKLICSLNGTNEIFMDADLRWNGPLPKIDGTTLFVNEFSFNQNAYYKELLINIFGREGDFGTMKNTSFFSWNSFKLSDDQVNRIFQLENTLFDFLNSQYSNLKSKENKNERLSEQIALSLALEEFQGIQISFLKNSDGFKDGSFVESSYFGATGASF